MKNESTKRALEQRIAELGFAVRYVEYCEDSRTPGFLGSIAGVTDWERLEVKIGLKANKTTAALIDTLSHELRHVEEPEWDCGNREVFGRGPSTREAVSA